jgi:CheY-like chemotaxis protein
MLTVLVIEDEPITAQMLVDVLALKGYAGHQAATAQEGIDLARTIKPNLILLAMSLPGMNGLEVAKLLKQDPVTQHIPIIAVTALPMMDGRELALSAGCDEYEPKPINMNNLMKKIRKFLNEKEV